MCLLTAYTSWHMNTSKTSWHPRVKGQSPCLQWRSIKSTSDGCVRAYKPFTLFMPVCLYVLVFLSSALPRSSWLEVWQESWTGQSPFPPMSSNPTSRQVSAEVNIKLWTGLGNKTKTSYTWSAVTLSCVCQCVLFLRSWALWLNLIVALHGVTHNTWILHFTAAPKVQPNSILIHLVTDQWEPISCTW